MTNLHGKPGRDQATELHGHLPEGRAWDVGLLGRDLVIESYDDLAEIRRLIRRFASPSWRRIYSMALPGGS